METEEGLLRELEPFFVPSVDEVHPNSNIVKWEGVICFSKCCSDLLVGVESTETKRRIFQRFVQGCDVQSKLHHPNVLQFIGLYRGESPFDVTMLTEHMCTDLDQYLRTHSSPLPSCDKIFLLFDVSNGLRYLHSRNPPVAHRELTARNVFLSADLSRAKIGDLGVLSILENEMSHLALWKKIAESLPYVAPEAREQLSQRSLEADVYSFGVLALYVATEVPPTADCTAADVGGDRRSEEQRRLLNALGKEHSLYEVITSCLKYAPLGRPTAVELSKMLEARGGDGRCLDPLTTTLTLAKSRETVLQKDSVMMDLKRVAKLQTELIESRNQIKQIESALKEVKVHLDVQQRSEQENLEKVLREMEAKDKEIQACKLQLEELKNECLKLKESSKAPPPIPDRPISNAKTGEIVPLPAKSPGTPPEVFLRHPAKLSAARRQNSDKNSAYQVEEEPQLYEEPVEMLTTQPWFYEKIDVMSTEARLHAKNWTGAYLVRESTSMKGQYTLSLLYNCDVRHMRILEPQPKKYTLDSASFFSSVRSLIQHYHSHPLYLETGGRTILKDEN